MEKVSACTRVGIGVVFDAVDYVRDPSCGAICTFEGITRDSFGGKRVVELSYEAYEPMALKVLEDIAKEVIASGAARCAMYHKIGVVPVSQASIMIAVSAVILSFLRLK
jgi:molybdopterin synthase catalytic subunit